MLVLRTAKTHKWNKMKKKKKTKQKPMSMLCGWVTKYRKLCFSRNDFHFHKFSRWWTFFFVISVQRYTKLTLFCVSDFNLEVFKYLLRRLCIVYIKFSRCAFFRMGNFAKFNFNCIWQSPRIQWLLNRLSLASTKKTNRIAQWNFDLI